MPHVSLFVFFLMFKKMSTCQFSSVPHRVNYLYLFSPYIHLFLSNLVLILFEIEQFYPFQN